MCTVQAAGATPGPRRSARFAAKEEPDPASSHSTRQPPPAGSAQAQQQRSWLQTLKWTAWAVLGVLVAVLAATNPTRDGFVESMRQLTSKGLGQWAGEDLTRTDLWKLRAHCGFVCTD